MFILIVRLIFAYKVFDAKGLTFTQSMMYHLYMLVSVEKHFCGELDSELHLANKEFKLSI